MTDETGNKGAEQSLRKLPGVRGLAWFTGSWTLLRRQPFRLLLISLFLQVLLSFSQTQALGLLVLLCLPALSAGMLQAFHEVESDKKPLLATLFLPFTSMSRTSRLLLLGALVMALGLLVVTLILSGQVVSLDVDTINRIEKGDLEAIGLLDPALIENAIMAMAIGTAISGSITYFAAPLIWFKEQSTGRAVVLGLKALALNWRPLLLVGLLLGLLAAPIAVLLASFYLSAINGASGSLWLGVLMLVLGPLFQLLLFGTQYLAFRDIFGLRTPNKNPADDAGNQLVA